MTLDLKKIKDAVIKEYFSLTGPSLPTGGSESYQTVGPFAQYMRSSGQILDRILDIVNDDIAEIDQRDAEELLFQSIPKLRRKISTVEDAIKKKAGLGPKKLNKKEPLTPPEER